MNQKSVLIGLILLMTGLVTGLSSLELLPENSGLYIVAGAFLAAYIFVRRKLGFLIAGLMAGTVAAFTSLKDYLGPKDGVYFLIFLGLAFIAIFFIHTFRINKEGWGVRYWPLFPGISLIMIGSLVALVQNGILDFDLKYLNLITPVTLAIIGVAVMAKGLRKVGGN